MTAPFDGRVALVTGAGRGIGRAVTLQLAERGTKVALLARSVDTAMQAWFRSQPPEQIGAALHRHFQATYEQGALISPEQSARTLLARLESDASGEVWTADPDHYSHDERRPA